MSQNAAAINQEILDRLNRGSEITAAQVYHWMNRVKRKVCMRGSPMDFMVHQAVILAGSGSWTPGTTPNNNWDIRRTVLPVNFVAPIECTIFSANMMSSTDAYLIFGSTATLPLWVFPSTTTSGTAGITSDVSGDTLYPYYGINVTFVVNEMSDRGLTYGETEIVEAIESTSKHEVVFFSPVQRRFRARRATTEVRGLVVDSTEFQDLTTLTSKLTNLDGSGNGYASVPWAAKQLILGDELLTVCANGEFPFLLLKYYRVPPDYNEPSIETVRAGTVTEDIFTRTAEDLLIFGAMELAYLYLDDDARAQRYAQRAAVEEAGFRKQHLITQSEAAGQSIRLRQGRAVSEWAPERTN